MTEADSSPLVLVSGDGPVTTITLNRPARRNALSVALLEQLLAAVAAAEADRTRRVLILCGEGPVFCAGLDLAEAGDPARVHHSAGLVARILQALGTTRLVTIAAVHGAAIAGGAGLMSACDLAVAAQGTQIGYPETRRGLVAALVMTFLLRQLRERDARELLLTGDLIDTARALAMGLINREVPVTDLRIEADRLADAVLRGGPEAVMNTKRFIAELGTRPLSADLERALAFHLEARQSAEAAEGIAAFHEKRPPQWTRRPV